MGLKNFKTQRVFKAGCPTILSARKRVNIKELRKKE